MLYSSTAAQCPIYNGTMDCLCHDGNWSYGVIPYINPYITVLCL